MEEKTKPEIIRQLYLKGKNFRVSICTCKDNDGIFVEVLTKRLKQKYPTKIAVQRAAYTLETFALLSSVYHTEMQIIADHIQAPNPKNIECHAKIYNNKKHLKNDTRF